MGYDPEVTNFALELVFNYGVSSYTEGDTLRAIALRSAFPVADALATARDLGYTQQWNDGGFQLLLENGYTPEHVGKKLESYSGQSWLLRGPDGYRFLLLPPVASAEPFDHIRLRVRDVAASADFYVRLLGMSVYSDTAIAQGMYPDWEGVVPHHAVVGYGPSGGSTASCVPLLFEQPAEEIPQQVTPWTGRQLITLPAAKLRIAYTWIHHYLPWSLVHVLQYSPKEDNTTILSAVIKDPDGNEITLASAELYDQEVQERTDFAGPDWTYRLQRQAAASSVPDPPLEPLCELYKCPMTFPDQRPVLPPWYSQAS